MQDCVVIVTGAAGSLGSAYCKEFARLGARIVVSDIGAGNPAEALAEWINKEFPVKEGKRAIACNESVDNEHGARKIVDAAMVQFKRVDVLINNAGNLRDSA